MFFPLACGRCSLTSTGLATKCGSAPWNDRFRAVNVSVRVSGSGRTRTFELPKTGHPTTSIPEVCALSVPEVLHLPLRGYLGSTSPIQAGAAAPCPGGKRVSLPSQDSAIQVPAAHSATNSSLRNYEPGPRVNLPPGQLPAAPLLDANPNRNSTDCTNRFTPTNINRHLPALTTPV